MGLLNTVFGLDSNAGASMGELNNGLQNYRDTVKSFESLDLPVKGNHQGVVDYWARRLGNVADLNAEPTAEQLKAMAVLAAGMPGYVDQHKQYYSNAKKALEGLTTIAKSAIDYDAAVTHQGVQLAQAQRNAASRVLSDSNALYNDALTFYGESLVARGQSPSLRTFGAQAGGFM